MSSYESVRETRSRSRERGDRRPRADRIAVDVSWSDQADFVWSEPRSRRPSEPTRSRRSSAEPDHPEPRHADSRRSDSLHSEAPSASPAPAPAAAPSSSTPAPSPAPRATAPVQAAPTTEEPVAAPARRPADAPESASPAVPASEPTRRTVVIRGHGHGHYDASRRGYEARLRPHERTGFKPDRVALWAVLLGLALLLGAVTSSHAATLHPELLHHLLLHAKP